MSKTSSGSLRSRHPSRQSISLPSVSFLTLDFTPLQQLLALRNLAVRAHAIYNFSKDLFLESHVDQLLGLPLLHTILLVLDDWYWLPRVLERPADQLQHLRWKDVGGIYLAEQGFTIQALVRLPSLTVLLLILLDMAVTDFFFLSRFPGLRSFGLDLTGAEPAQVAEVSTALLAQAAWCMQLTTLQLSMIPWTAEQLTSFLQQCPHLTDLKWSGVPKSGPSLF
jgi:hypothetical protein